MPARPQYPAHIIAARGKPIELMDGSKVTIVYGFASIMRLEEDFGTLGDAMRKLGDGSLTTVARIMAAGLLHETHGAGLLSDVDVLGSLLDTLSIEAYSNAVGEAFEAAFPKSDDDDEHVGDEADPTEGAHRSPGPSGTTPPLSASDGQMLSSGV